MTKRDGVYKCEVCGNVVEVLHAADGDLVCCGQDMVLLEANTVDTSHEKHVPVIEQSGRTVTVKIGSEPHPMEEKHYIEVVGVWADNKLYRAYLKPGDKPEATFELDAKAKYARAYCNLHGLWQST
jgi:superoxide reductase